MILFQTPRGPFLDCPEPGQVQLKPIKIQRVSKNSVKSQICTFTLTTRVEKFNDFTSIIVCESWQVEGILLWCNTLEQCAQDLVLAIKAQPRSGFQLQTSSTLFPPSNKCSSIARHLLPTMIVCDPFSYQLPCNQQLLAK